MQEYFTEEEIMTGSIYYTIYMYLQIAIERNFKGTIDHLNHLKQIKSEDQFHEELEFYSYYLTSKFSNKKSLKTIKDTLPLIKEKLQRARKLIDNHENPTDSIPAKDL
jgi:ABC-type transport system involved in cytochrome c biogenesis ATPase subunit